jgi:hypothetical protein
VQYKQTRACDQQTVSSFKILPPCLLTNLPSLIKRFAERSSVTQHKRPGDIHVLGGVTESYVRHFYVVFTSGQDFWRMHFHVCQSAATNSLCCGFPRVRAITSHFVMIVVGHVSIIRSTLALAARYVT